MFGEGDGYAAAAGADVEDAGWIASFLAMMGGEVAMTGRGSAMTDEVNEFFCFGAGNQDGRGYPEWQAAKFRLAENILYRLHRSKPVGNNPDHIFLVFRNYCIFAQNLAVERHFADMRQDQPRQAAYLARRIQGFEPLLYVLFRLLHGFASIQYCKYSKNEQKKTKKECLLTKISCIAV